LTNDILKSTKKLPSKGQERCAFLIDIPHSGMSPYTVETDVTTEEIAMIDEGVAEYRANPASFVPLEHIL
jgi:hypothetical protein